jgi:hypothetical protein
MARDILKSLADASIAALRVRGGEWPRNLLAETLIPDAWMGIVLQPDGRRRFVPAGEDPRPERDDTLVLVRNRAIAVPLELHEAPASSGHGVHARVELLVRAPARDDELAALARTLVTGDALGLDALAEYLWHGAARAALQRFIRERPAAALVYDDLRAALLEHLRNELKGVLFAAGLVLERLGAIECTSPALIEEEARQRATARKVSELEARGVVERAALAATQRRLDDLGSVLGKLRQAEAEGSGLKWHELLPSLTPGERGRLLESLWRLTPDREVATAVVVVAGRMCAWIDPAALEAPPRQVTLPDDLGGLRSVDYDAAGDTLLVGAATGVWRVQAGDGTVLAHYAVPQAEAVRTGFNAAVIGGERLYATHSQLGAWSWPIAHPGDAAPLLRPVAGVPRTVRGVFVDAQGHVVLAADTRVHAFDAQGEEAWATGAAEGSIQCLAALEERLYAGTATGALLRCDLRVPGEWLVVHRTTSAIESVQARRWDDLVELVIPAGAAGVAGVYADEGLVARLLHGGLAIRRAWACDDCLVGLNENRDRLVVLTATMPGRSGVEVPIARLLGHPVQDVGLVTRKSRE